MLLSYHCESKEIKSCRDRPLREKCSARRSRLTSRVWRHDHDWRFRQRIQGHKCEEGWNVFVNLPNGLRKNLFRCEHPVTTRMFKSLPAAFPKCGTVISETVHEWRAKCLCIYIFCVRSDLGCWHVEYDRLLPVLRMPVCTWRLFFLFAPQCRISPIDCFACTLYTIPAK